MVEGGVLPCSDTHTSYSRNDSVGPRQHSSKLHGWRELRNSNRKIDKNTGSYPTELVSLKKSILSRGIKSISRTFLFDANIVHPLSKLHDHVFK